MLLKAYYRPYQNKAYYSIDLLKIRRVIIRDALLLEACCILEVKIKVVENKFYLSRLYKSRKNLNYKGESVTESLDRINIVYLKTETNS